MVVSPDQDQLQDFSTEFSTVWLNYDLCQPLRKKFHRIIHSVQFLDMILSQSEPQIVDLEKEFHLVLYD